MAAGQIKLIVIRSHNCEIGSATTMIQAVANVCELLKREGCIVLEPKLNVLVGDVPIAVELRRVDVAGVNVTRPS